MGLSMNAIVRHERKRIAAELHNRTGYRGVDTREVAAAAGVSINDVIRAWINPDHKGKQSGDVVIEWPVAAAEPLIDALTEQPLHPIVALYYQHLGRAPDAAGLEYWVGELERGVPWPDLKSEWLKGARAERAKAEKA